MHIICIPYDSFLRSAEAAIPCRYHTSRPLHSIYPTVSVSPAIIITLNTLNSSTHHANVQCEPVSKLKTRSLDCSLLPIASVSIGLVCCPASPIYAEEKMEPATTEMSIPRRRGILALIDGELQSYEYDAQLLEKSTAAMRRKRKRFEQQTTISRTTRQEYYNPSRSEWTLFFFGSSNNLNCLRFRPILVDFCQNHPDKVQCICVPNDEEELLVQGTGFYCLPWGHTNRSALLTLLAVTQVPTLVVVSNHDGRRITDRGMSAIESNTTPSLLFERWRKGESWTSSICMIS